MDLLETALRSIQRNGLIREGSTVVIGVSGGPDSLALLHVLRQLSSQLSLRLHVATFDHQLRGESSIEDTRFVEQIGREWGVPVTVGRGDVRQIAETNNIGIEAAARRARYDFMAQVAREVGASHVAVAHHADDQAETVLIHIIRGSGLDGLSGMAAQAPLPGHPDITLIRPFLKATRAQIEAYCQEHHLNPREDITNRDTSLLRNFIRWETLPHLEKLNTNVRQALAQLADIAQVERDYMERALQQVIVQHVTLHDHAVEIGREQFRTLHPALQRRYVYWAARRVLRNDTATGYLHVVSAVEIGVRGSVGATALLAGGARLRVDYDTLVIERTDVTTRLPDVPLIAEETEVAVTIPGTTRLPDGTWMLRSWVAGNKEKAQARLAIPDRSRVVLRSRRDGDRIAPLGLGGHTQKVGRWMINHKIPKAIRDRIPLLIVNGEIAAICTGTQWAIGETFAVNKDTPCVYFAWEKNEP